MPDMVSFPRMSIYIHKQEVWSEKKCERQARRAPKDAWGNPPPKGIIARAGCPHVQYGKTIRFNGGCIREGEWYEGEYKPLPIIPDTYEIVPLSSWGLIISKKQPL